MKTVDDALEIRGRVVVAADLSIAGHQFTGFFAWLIWGVVHIFPLVNFRSKLIVLFAWAWSYFTQSKNVRLITGESRIKVKKPFGIVSKDDDSSS